MLTGRVGKGYETRARQRHGRGLVGRKSLFCAGATRAREGLFAGAMRAREREVGSLKAVIARKLLCECARCVWGNRFYAIA